METYKRSQINTLLSRLSERPRHLIFVTGPRQSGKTTLVLQALNQTDTPSEYASVDESATDFLQIRDPRGFTPEFEGQSERLLDSTKDTQWLVEKWQQARLVCERSDRGFILAIDEIQQIPNWSETVKGLWDSDRRNNRPLHVVLLGSSPLLMLQGTSESLLGRFETIPLTHWSFAEMSEAFDFDLEQYIYFGGYPGAALFIQDQSRWRRYINDAVVEPSIEREILALQRVDKPVLLRRVFEFGSEHSGQIFSFNRMLGQLDDAGNATTLARYTELLSKAGLMAGLSKYAGGIYRRRASSPKLNVLNTSLMTVASGYTFEQAKADRSYWGRLVETAVGAHLFNTGVPDYRLFYWRENGFEVDYVLTRGRRLVGFEVKSGARSTKTIGLEKFKELSGVQAAVVVGEGGVPIMEFLSESAQYWFDNL